MQANKYSIKQWAKEERPREKLLLNGAENLSNSELMAILIHHGSRDKTAVDLARDVLKLGKDNLAELGKLSVRDFILTFMCSVREPQSPSLKERIKTILNKT